MQLPVPVGPRTTTGHDFFFAIDFSASVDVTDPSDARLDELHHALKWLDKHAGADDRVAVSGFDVFVGPADLRSAPEARLAAETELRSPGGGGTLYSPVIEKALALRNPNRPLTVCLITDGMAQDLENAADLVRRHDLHVILVPFGSEWPMIAAAWPYEDAFELAAHVQDRKRMISRTISLIALNRTQQAYGPPPPPLRTAAKAKTVKRFRKGKR